MTVSERESGIVEQHAKAIAQTAAIENTFIFVRPTEYDSTILIRAGYATKSMDVHHKSSNWGPMAGFVPCDPAFSKKCEGTPNPEEHEHKHGAAHPVQLALKPALLNEHEKIEFQSDYILAAAEGGDKLDVPWVVRRNTGKGTVGTLKGKFEALAQSGHIPQHKFCTAKPADFGNKSTLFCLIEKAGEWLVYWVKWDGETGRLNPLRVFAYAQRRRLNPVTGDYDLWMVAPHFTHLDKHAAVRLAEDTHGSSAASGYTLNLIERMNSACGRSDNPVFNHGAEAQNYGFTQALDWNLAMFTPSGSSRMVRMNQMPGILADLQRAGYLVVWNKRYGETDARLMGAGDKRGGESLAKLRLELDQIFHELDEIRRTVDSGAIAKQIMSSRSTGTPMMPTAMKSELSKMAQRFETTRTLGLEQSRIYRFHRKLLDFLETQIGKFRVLSPGDFAANVRTYERDMLRMHDDLQRALVAATIGSGQSDEAQLSEWFSSHQSQIDELKRFWR
ncbi:MAG TPA: anthrax toxin-like adenylyl cyclase domain-containing protein [Pirellulales bacterium]|nr:anthrax toxin-like adenylyl cyclase domain-containing protein [Pirellulales bacterium]